MLFRSLVQHIVTRALGGGFGADALYDEVRTTASFATLAREEFDWCVELALSGGRTLSAYPQYHRIARGEDGRFAIAGRRAAQLHRLNIGTISADATISVAFVGGRRLGSIEEGFIARLEEGDGLGEAAVQLDLELHRVGLKVDEAPCLRVLGKRQHQLQLLLPSQRRWIQRPGLH